ncbi:hypothetical protein FT663_01391 [Candidozyma haemuli var. vulneris]|uniref:ATPase expression protein 1 n=1 Tax=Candidozyma haemuli TaxID=45357 RepID=A0A2V1AYX9_9ASCO|nr:hypothetical protein CXQ85_002768 [[Candida] haemuloni]KAF3992526.1 hypothetical protein FT662_01072 [[Candida] haemuloni var. vulneris]KAF3994478.1 hypothetical protein FT663_01391 [[Candida] haemuloni var. vulneris]PVH23042.1 hypothetical protein CXQ85_002768 [[Candida] haemuloni]
MASRLARRGFSQALRRMAAEEPVPSATQTTPNEELDHLVPDRPDFSSYPREFSPMIDPREVHDVLLRPTFNDLAVTTIASDSPFTGDESYKFTTKPSERGSKFLFGSMTDKWIKEFNALNPRLDEIPEYDTLFSFLGSRLDDVSFAESISSLGDLEKSIKYSAPEMKPGDVIHALLSEEPFQLDITKYNLVIEYLKRHLTSKSSWVSGTSDFPMFLDFLAQNSQTYSMAEKASALDSYFGAVFAEEPSLFSKVSPSTLDILTKLACESHNLKGAMKTLESLVKHHTMAPSKGNFQHFMQLYSESARQENKNKEQILEEITWSKPILFHHGLDVNSFELLLSRLIDNSYDLTQFVRLARNSGLLPNYAGHVLVRLYLIQKQSPKSPIAKAVEITQFVRLLLRDGNVRVDRNLRSTLRMICEENKIPYDESTFLIKSS